MRIMVVDDEQEIRDYLADMPEWQLLGCKVTGKATDGADALAQMEMADPDVVITDIMMPVMNGIELAEVLRRRHPNLPIIFLTAYNEFEYAKKAVKLGVSDFVTKPFVPKDLIQCIETLREHGTQWQSFADHDELFEYFSRTDITDGQKRQWLQDRGIKDQPFVLLYADLDNGLESYEGHRPFSHLMLKKRIGDAVSRDGCRYWIAPSRNGIYFPLFFEEEACGQIKDRSLAIARDIVNEAGKNHEITVSVGISSLISSLLLLPKGIHQISECMDYRMLLGRKSIIAHDALVNLKEEREKEKQISLDQLEDFLRAADLEGILAFLRSVYRHMLVSGAGRKEMHHYCIRMVEKSELVLEQLGVELSSRDKMEIREQLLSRQILTDLMQSMERKLSADTERIKHQLQQSVSRVIMETKQIIETEYRQDLTLQKIAQRININYSYLSRIIKKETGKNFSELLWEQRIEAAKQKLVHEDMKAYEVAYDVGFKDPTHFNLLFKKKVGMTPGAYRAGMTRSTVPE